MWFEIIGLILLALTGLGSWATNAETRKVRKALERIEKLESDGMQLVRDNTKEYKEDRALWRRYHLPPEAQTK